MNDDDLSADNILGGRAGSPAQAVRRELAHGNGSLISILQMAGLAGPFKRVDPWRLEDERGVVRINGGGYAALPFGERYPPLRDFLIRYLQEDRGVGLPQQAVSRWRGALAARLVSKLALFAPFHADSQVFFSNSGAEAIESAIKFAAHYRPRARYFINFSRAYHGKTSGALALTPNPEYQKQLRHFPLDVVTLPFGDAQRFEDELRRLGANTIAAVIVEPVQGEAGVIIPPREFLEQVSNLCRRHGIVLIADEIQTGLGRSGYWFASVEWGHMEPDIITLAKPLGGGMTAIGATIARRNIYRKMLGGLNAKAQSSTFGGNNLAMATGLKSLDILEDENLVHRAREMGRRGEQRLQRLAARYPRLIKETRAFGMLFAVSFQPASPSGRIVYGPRKLNAELTGLLGLMSWHEAGVMANFSLNAHSTVRLTPALTMPAEIFDQMFDYLEEAAASAPSSWKMLRQVPPRTLVRLARLGLFS